MLVVGHDHGNMAVGSIILSVVPISKLIGTRKSEFAGTHPPANHGAWSVHAMPSAAVRGMHGWAIGPGSTYCNKRGGDTARFQNPCVPPMGIRQDFGSN